MKLYLTLTFFYLVMLLLARSQTLPANGSVWLVRDLSFDIQSGDFTSACWPNGTVTVSYDNSDIIFTTTGWSGPDCSEYGLIGGNSFILPQNNSIGNINESIQFAYNIFNSSFMEIEFWFGCNGPELICLTTATVYLTYEGLGPCLLEIDSTPFNLCPLESKNTYYKVSNSFEGTLSFSLINSIVPNCNGTKNISATFLDSNGDCYDVADQNPSYSDYDDRLYITFASLESDLNQTYQLLLILTCDENNATSLNTFSNSGFSLTALPESNTTIFYVQGSSPYGCSQTGKSSQPLLGCPFTIVNGTKFNFCSFYQDIFNVSDNFGGYLLCNMGPTPLIPKCPGNADNQTNVWATYYSDSGECFSLGAWDNGSWMADFTYTVFDYPAMELNNGLTAYLDVSMFCTDTITYTLQSEVHFDSDMISFNLFVSSMNACAITSDTSDNSDVLDVGFSGYTASDE